MGVIYFGARAGKKALPHWQASMSAWWKTLRKKESCGEHIATNRREVGREGESITKKKKSKPAGHPKNSGGTRQKDLALEFGV